MDEKVENLLLSESTIETIDSAFYNFIDETLNLSCATVPRAIERICKCVYVPGMELKVIVETGLLTVVVAIESQAGGLDIVTLLDAALGALYPVALPAATVNVYAVPAVNPDTVIGDAVASAVKLPGLDVAVYFTCGPPTEQVVGVNATDADTPLPLSVAVPIETVVLGMSTTLPAFGLTPPVAI